ncbi:hypothetical protein ACO1B2_10060 [Staphylococcus saprophyticus]|uniref:hypothetical protein n=1 Tax=Staphylococcus TaxID=1279 RepID=UPI00085324EB|nr:hypothetical protein [Staphylococcus equorum]OEK70666.1 hypothetical protein AST02_04215 [Staphylococcus equorum]
MKTRSEEKQKLFNRVEDKKREYNIPTNKIGVILGITGTYYRKLQNTNCNYSDKITEKFIEFLELSTDEINRKHQDKKPKTYKDGLDKGFEKGYEQAKKDIRMKLKQEINNI